MEINGLNLTVVTGRELAGQLGLKDGQQIVGRLISTSPQEALLQLAGKAIPARVQGTQLPAGTVALFRVSLADNGMVELKVLTQLNGVDTAGKPVGQTADLRLMTAVCAVLQESGLAVSTENINAVCKEIADFENKLQQPLNPQVLVFLLKQKLPLSSETILLAWLYQDRDLRNYLWNTLRNSPVVRRNPDFLPKVVDLADDTAGSAQSEVRVGKTVAETTTSTLGPRQPETLSEREAHQLKTLLEQSAKLEQLVTPRPADGTEMILPLLVNVSANLVEEYRLQWREKDSANTAQTEREEWIRLTIPTENLGEINLTMLVSTGRLRIGFKVDSATVREYLLQHLPDLQTALDVPAQITVGLNDLANNSDSRVDLWM